jgi:hypothetical protein
MKVPNFDAVKEKPKPKWADANRDRFRRSKKHEERVAGVLGGKRLPRSGGLAWSRSDATTAGGDLKTEVALVEHKRTENQSISLKKEWLHKVAAAAKRSNKDPAIVITFEEKLQPPEDWILIPVEVYRRLLAEKEEK